jgi:hypothetical protein
VRRQRVDGYQTVAAETANPREKGLLSEVGQVILTGTEAAFPDPIKGRIKERYR